MDNEKTGSLIRRLRRERGLTQQQLAEQLGVSDKAVSKWERGLGGPELGLLRKLYPEWEVQTRLPFWGHSRLYFYCTQHGLFWQKV